MRGLVLAAVVATVMLSGCVRPLAEGAEPSRESVRITTLPFSGEPKWVNTTLHVSPVPNEAAGLISPDAPHNCFRVDDAATGDENRDSYLGGFLVNLTWEALPGMEELNVTVWGPNPEGISSWSWQGPSPLDGLAFAGDEKPVRTPFVVEVRSATLLPVGDQPVDLRVATGILESAIAELAWEQCPTVPLPVALP